VNDPEAGESSEEPCVSGHHSRKGWGPNRRSALWSFGYGVVPCARTRVRLTRHPWDPRPTPQSEQHLPIRLMTSGTSNLGRTRGKAQARIQPLPAAIDRVPVPQSSPPQAAVIRQGGGQARTGLGPIKASPFSRNASQPSARCRFPSRLSGRGPLMLKGSAANVSEAARRAWGAAPKRADFKDDRASAATALSLARRTHMQRASATAR
jgi:hypothetical protein